MSIIEPAWDERGLVPAIVQDAATATVLMLAWMNAEALRLTRDTGYAHFWSRSRQALWKKGETSGHTLAVVEVRIDCDADTILVRARPAGPACHTGKPACFYRMLDGAEDDGIPAATGGELDKLATVLVARKSADAGTSYTAKLLAAGMPAILAKIAEEHAELAAELPDGADGKVVHETADLLYHVLVGLVARDIPVERVWAELARRAGTSGLAEKAARR